MNILKTSNKKSKNLPNLKKLYKFRIQMVDNHGKLTIFDQKWSKRHIFQQKSIKKVVKNQHFLCYIGSPLCRKTSFFVTPMAPTIGKIFNIGLKAPF